MISKIRDSYLLDLYLFNKYSKIQILILNIHGVLAIIAIIHFIDQNLLTSLCI